MAVTKETFAATCIARLYIIDRLSPNCSKNFEECDDYTKKCVTTIVTHDGYIIYIVWNGTKAYMFENKFTYDGVTDARTKAYEKLHKIK